MTEYSVVSIDKVITAADIALCKVRQFFLFGIFYDWWIKNGTLSILGILAIYDSDNYYNLTV